MADLVLVHGWCGDRTTTEPLAQRLGQQSHRAITLELPGHGGTPSEASVPRHVSIESYGQYVHQAAIRAGLHEPVVVGHSMGGLVALAALTDPATPFRGAVLLDPAPIVNTPAKSFWHQAAEAVTSDHDGSWRRTFADGLFLPTDRAGRAEVLDQMGAFPSDRAAAEARAMADFDGAGALAALRHRLLIIHADTVERGLADHFTDRSLLTTGQTVGAGHFHHLEVPEQVVPMIQRWLRIVG